MSWIPEALARVPIVALAPMDGYTDGPYRRIVKSVNKNVICFTEFFSADGIVKSKHLAKSVLPHHDEEKPLVVQIFGKDPAMFREAAKIIESYGVAGVDVNMGCPAKKVVRSGHGSSLMINRTTAFRIVEEMAKVVKIPVSVKTRLGYENDNFENLIEFAQGLENAGAKLLTVHGRTFKQAFTGEANWAGIYELKKHLTIPILGNGDVKDYADGMRKLLPSYDNEAWNSPLWDWTIGMRRNKEIFMKSEYQSEAYEDVRWARNGALSENFEVNPRPLDGFMIGRASFGNPWCFDPEGKKPTFIEILAMMRLHAKWLIETKGKKWALEIRKHLVMYLHGFHGVKHFRKELVTVESFEDVEKILGLIEKQTMLDGE